MDDTRGAKMQEIHDGVIANVELVIEKLRRTTPVVAEIDGSTLGIVIEPGYNQTAHTGYIGISVVCNYNEVAMLLESSLPNLQKQYGLTSVTCDSDVACTRFFIVV